MGQIIELWNKILAPLGFPSVSKGTPERKRHFEARLGDDKRRWNIVWWETLFKLMTLSDFLVTSAKEHARWLSFDWVLNESNLVKITEGKYNNAEKADDGETIWALEDKP